MKKIECMVYSRVVGYFSEVGNWNRGKKSEWAERKPYDIKITKEVHDINAMRKLLVEEGVLVARG